jgi:hypothetical protein
MGCVDASGMANATNVEIILDVELITSLQIGT